MTEPQNPLGRHPKGTLAIIVAYGLAFVVGWLAVYFLVYIPRGGVVP